MESNSLLKVGTLLNHAKYRIERYLASGGFGNTYEGVNVSLGKKCAIKEFFLKGVVLRDEHTSEVFITHPDNKKAFNSQKEKFTKEARRLSRLDNSHIVRVFDFFEENGTAYYVMDYIEGESLRELQKRTGKALTEQETLSVLTQMLDALKSIHEAGLLHMDIKPANIMIDQKGKCTLIDFGASKQPSVSDGATTSSAMAYTPGFAPTEQIGGSSDRWGPWTDFYALGATLYNLLTNKNPANLDIEVDGADAFKFPPNVSDSMRSLIQWLMTPKRTERPQNVDAIRNCLNQLELNVGRPLSIKEGNQPMAGNQPAGELIPEPKESTADAESTEIESAEVAEPAEPKNEIDSKAMDSGDITEPTAPMADTEVPEAEEASQEEATCIEAEKAIDSSTDAAAPETADSSSNENDNASEGEGAPISFPNDNRDIKKKKGHLGKWVAVALFSLLLVVAFVFLVKSIDSDSGNGTKTNKTTISADKKNVSDAKKGKSAKSNNEQYRPVNKGNTVRQESQHASSKTPSQSNNPSQLENNVKPQSMQLGRQINSKTENNNSRTMNQTNTCDRDVEPTAAPAADEASVEPAQRKSRNAISSNEHTSSNGQNKKAEKVKAQANVQAVKQQNRNANSSTSAQSVKNKQSEIDAAWGNVDNSNSAKANEIDAAW